MSANQLETPKANILVVDDTPDNLGLMMEILTAHGYEVRLASNGPLALRSVQASLPDLILLDIKMPDLDGYQVCEQLKADDHTRDIPIIFLSALYNVSEKVKGFAIGGVDYITKPFYAEEVVARVQTHLMLRQLQRQLQEQNLLLAEQNVRFRALAEATFEGIVIHEGERIVDVNQLFERTSGYSYAELIGKPVLDFVAPAWRDSVFVHLRNGAEYPYEVQGLRKNGTVFPAEVQAKTMPSPSTSLRTGQGHNVRVVAIRDLSWQKAMEAENAQLHHENVALKATLKDRYKFGPLIGRSPAMHEVYELIVKAAATDANVVIYGESGVGKDLIAQTIHQRSKRRDKAFVAVNCGSIPETLFESEFFGYHKGAFTGALRDKPGFFDAAQQGTLFLDEVGELNLNMQVKLLRAIEGKGYTPIGAQIVKQADVRIVAATNRDLQALVKQGLLREDFFYRINVIPIAVPPLRDRREDIPLLVEHFLKHYTETDVPPMLPGKILDSLYKQDWPGNIRQLQNVLQRYLTLKRLDFEDLHTDQAVVSSQTLASEATTLRETLADVEKHFILKILDQHHGHRQKAARILGIPLRTLQRKISKYRLLKNKRANNGR